MASLKVIIISFGVIGVWIWCAGAAFIPALAVYGFFQTKQLNDLFIAFGFAVVIAVDCTPRLIQIK
jgi:hypothetical protein